MAWKDSHSDEMYWTSVPRPRRHTAGRSVDDTIRELKQFVNVEYDTQKVETLRLWNEPIGTRVSEGEAIADVEVVEVTWNRAVLRCRDNVSKFRRADYLVLSRGSPTENPRFKCVLEEDLGSELVIHSGYQANFTLLSRGGGWVLDRDVVDIRNLLLGTLDTLWSTPVRCQEILGVLHGEIPVRSDAARERTGAALAPRLGLNTVQGEAFARAYGAENYTLIQGPPGTGKTWVLAHLAATLAREGQRVLVTAFTHRAINNALRKIAKETGYPQVIKVGQADHARDLAWDGGVVPNFETYNNSPYSPSSQGVIVGGTCFAVRGSRLREVAFDTVIFDEAGQVTLPLAIAGMMAGRRHIFIGDHQQMAPVIAGVHREDWVTRSVFETLFRHSPGTMLDLTYRMNEEINAFPSKRFYGGRLRPTPDAAGRRLKLSRSPQRYRKTLDPERPSVFVKVEHANRGMRSEEEARVAAGIAAEALACGVPPHEIAIVAPYRAQGRLIRSLLREQASHLAEEGLTAIVVDTVERIQGQERDMVIVSLTTSDPAHAARRAEFYFQPNRLNVSITRPKVKRIVIGSPLLFEAKPEEKKHRQWVEHFRALHDESVRIRINP